MTLIPSSFDNVLNKFSFIASWHLIFFCSRCHNAAKGHLKHLFAARPQENYSPEYLMAIVERQQPKIELDRRRKTAAADKLYYTFGNDENDETIKC